MPNDDEGVGVKKEVKAELIKTQNQNCNFDNYLIQQCLRWPRESNLIFDDGISYLSSLFNIYIFLDFPFYLGSYITAK